MPKQKDFFVNSSVVEIMGKLIKAFPSIFQGFDVLKIACVHTKDKRCARNPISIKAVPYPYSVWMTQTYICEVSDKTWIELTDRQKNLAVFHTMCAIPEGGFDEQSKNYARIRKPDYEIYSEEFAITGGIPNWMENEAAVDPLQKVTKSDKRKAVTPDAVASV